MLYERKLFDEKGSKMIGDVRTKVVQKTNDQQNLVPCSHCGGGGRLSDGLPKSQWPGLDWLSYDGEVCTSCGGSGKVPAP